MPLPLMAIGAGLSAIGAVGKFLSGRKQAKEAKKINPIFNQYKTNPLANQQLALAKNMFGGRMAGAQNLEQNIFSNQANTLDSVSRNATDASQALAAAAGVQGQTNDNLAGIQTMEAQNKYNMLGNLNNAYAQLIGEGDKEYNSMFQKYQMDASRKDALMGAGAQNQYGAVNDIGSMLMQFQQLKSGKIGGKLGAMAGMAAGK
jgi:hypothetical protein